MLYQLSYVRGRPAGRPDALSDLPSSEREVRQAE